MGLRFKLDENLPREAEKTLLERGHDCHSVLSEGLGGSADERLMTVCIREQRILVTPDRDFSDIRRYPPGSHSGVWILRPESQDVTAISTLLERALRMSDKESAGRNLWVIGNDRIRIRDRDL